MKRHWLWSLPIGLVVGVVIGFVLGAQSSQWAVPKGTALLRGFSLTAVAAKAGQTNWQIFEDRIYEPFPTQGRSKRIARRIVARANIASYTESGDFAAQFQEAASAALDAFGARNTGQFDLVYDSARTLEGLARSRFDLPRRYYAIGDTHGVADIGYLMEGGRVTVIVSLIEGP